MEKKMYQMPEVEVIDLELNAPILTVSDPDQPQIIPGEGDTGGLG